jgi:hypothetical protein
VSAGFDFWCAFHPLCSEWLTLLLFICNYSACHPVGHWVGQNPASQDNGEQQIVHQFSHKRFSFINSRSLGVGVGESVAGGKDGGHHHNKCGGRGVCEPLVFAASCVEEMLFVRAG